MDQGIENVIRRLKVLVLGAGHMAGDHYLPFLEKRPDVELVGVVRRRGIPVSVQTPVYAAAQLDEAIERHRPDLAIIATPHAYHYSQTKKCLQSGCHVLVEKPLALEYRQCLELVELAETEQRLLVVNLQRRYEGPAAIHRALAAEGRLGTLRMAYGTFTHRFAGGALETPDHWRRDRAIAGSGIVDDSAYHLIDLLVYFAASPVLEEDVSAILVCEGGVARAYASVFQTTEGICVSASGSYLGPTDTVEEQITLIGSKGSLFIRRFRKQWDATPPDVFYKSTDGRAQKDYDLGSRPVGRLLSLQALLDVLSGTTGRHVLLTEGKEVLQTHLVIAAIRAGKVVEMRP